MKKTKEIPLVLLKEKGILTISSRIENEINQLHAHCGNNEWSGLLIYKITKGSIEDSQNLCIEALNLYPLDIGTSCGTEYEIDEKICDVHDLCPEIMEENLRLGHVHSHHQMNAYFSSTDEDELKENTKNHSYYLSLIVNIKKEYAARLCVMGERRVKNDYDFSFNDIQGKNILFNQKDERKEAIVIAMDMDIKMPENKFGEIIKSLEEDKENKKKMFFAETGQNQSVMDFNSYDAFDNHSLRNFEKEISTSQAFVTNLLYNRVVSKNELDTIEYPYDLAKLSVPKKDIGGFTGKVLDNFEKYYRAAKQMNRELPVESHDRFFDLKESLVLLTEISTYMEVHSKYPKTILKRIEKELSNKIEEYETTTCI